MKDVVISLRYEDEPIGSLYNDDGTEKIFARLATQGDENFISFVVPKSFVSDVLDAAIEHNAVTEKSSVPAIVRDSVLNNGITPLYLHTTSKPLPYIYRCIHRTSNLGEVLCWPHLPFDRDSQTPSLEGRCSG